MYLIAIVSRISIGAYTVRLVVVVGDAHGMGIWPKASENGVISNINQLTLLILAIVSSEASLADAHWSLWSIRALKVNWISALEVVIASVRAVVT